MRTHAFIYADVTTAVMRHYETSGTGDRMTAYGLATIIMVLAFRYRF